MALFALYVSVGEDRLWPGLLIPAALALFGAWWPGSRYSGAALVAFGTYPALLVARALLPLSDDALGDGLAASHSNVSPDRSVTPMTPT